MTSEWFLRSAVGFSLIVPMIASYASKGGRLSPSIKLDPEGNPPIRSLLYVLVEAVWALPMLLIAVFGPTRFHMMLQSELGNSVWTGRVPLPLALQVAGGCVLLGGGFLIAWPRIALRHGWVRGVGINRARHQLVTTGLYSWVRHPMYLGYCLVAAGTFLATCNVVLGMLAAIVARGYCKRIPHEDRVLRKHFSKHYPAYYNRTPALIPRLWRRRA